MKFPIREQYRSLFSATDELSLVGSLLDDFSQLREVAVVVDPEQQLGQVRRALVVVLEVGQELKHLIRLPLKVDLQQPELLLK